MTVDLEVDRLLVRPVSIKAISRNGYEAALHLTEEEKPEICAFYDLLDIGEFAAEMLLTRRKKSGILLQGHLRARVTQSCVVTLQPVETVVDEPMHTLLVPERELDETHAQRDEDGALRLGLSDDCPETYQGSEINLGRLVLEHLSLGLDPYPRLAEAQLEGAFDDGPCQLKPFAALEQWQEKYKRN